MFEVENLSMKINDRAKQGQKFPKNNLWINGKS
jgi:hypothetical protein